VKRAGASSGCPPFVSADFQRALQDHRRDAELVATVFTVLGSGLVSSVVLAPIGVPIVAGAESLRFIANGCSTAEVMRSHCRAVRDACLLVAALFGAGSGVSLLAMLTDAGVITSVASVTLAGIGAACASMAPVFDGLSRGALPSWAVLQAAILAWATVGKVEAQVQSVLNVINIIIGDRDFQRAANAATKGATTRTPVRPTNDDVNLQLFANELLKRAQQGGTSATLDRYFSAYVAMTGNMVTGGPSAAVTYMVGNIWRAWRSAGHPTTGDGILAVLRRYLGTRAWFAALAAAYASPGSRTVIPKPSPSAGRGLTVRERVENGPRGTAPPPEEGGGLGLLVGVGLALKFLL
jgi:hypothetical protein